MNALDLKGKKFEQLTVISKSNERKYGKVIWFCKCDCGRITKATTGQLKSKTKKSCGCLKKTHQKKNRTTYEYRFSKIYKLWANMVERCHGKNPTKAKWYKDKGIKVCSEWRNALTFIKWAEKNGYKEGFSIHRKNNDKGYYAENCIFLPKSKHYKKHLGIRKKPLSNNTSGFIGVSYSKKNNFYVSYISYNGKRKHLGCFKTAIEANEKRLLFIKEKNL
jgi:heme-degrading monooxygenase HmoA